MNAPTSSADFHGPRLSAQKHAAIVEAAAALFLADGYPGTSMDQVAARAGVSKQTVYKHFEGKERLFLDVVESTVNKAGDPVYEEVQKFSDKGDLETNLRRLAARQLAAVMQPHLLLVRRLVIAEVERFPKLGEIFYERGQKRTLTALADLFQKLADQGLLELEDPAQAAEHFNWLVMSAPINRAMVRGTRDLPTAAELRRHAESGVRAFLILYGRADQPFAGR